MPELSVCCRLRTVYCLLSTVYFFLMTHLVFCIFLFALGACVGSFLNVVVWRLPRFGLGSLVSPPSHCPQCQHQLAWKDNIPVFGWIILRGRCRYCGGAISARYPTIEFIAGCLFVFYYLMFFVFQVSPCAPELIERHDSLLGRVWYEPRLMSGLVADWPMYFLYMFLIASLLAISLIDAELFIIPLAVPWIMAGVGMGVHALVDRPTLPGAINLTDPTGVSAAMALGGALGLLVSILLFMKGVIPESFPKGEPSLEIDEAAYQAELEAAKRENRRAEVVEPPPVYSRAEIRREIGKEVVFLLPPLVGSLLAVMLTQLVPPLREMWRAGLAYHWWTGLLGAVLGALVGGLVVWLTRILGTLGFGRVSMGLGDVHLMFGVGAIVGAGAATVAFFLAPFAGLLVGLYMLVSKKRHELPYGPYLSLATAAVVLFYCPIAEYLRPGLTGLMLMLRQAFGA